MKIEGLTCWEVIAPFINHDLDIVPIGSIVYSIEDPDDLDHISIVGKIDNHIFTSYININNLKLYTEEEFKTNFKRKKGVLHDRRTS